MKTATDLWNVQKVATQWPDLGPSCPRLPLRTGLLLFFNITISKQVTCLVPLTVKYRSGGTQVKWEETVDLQRLTAVQVTSGD